MSNDDVNTQTPSAQGSYPEADAGNPLDQEVTNTYDPYELGAMSPGTTDLSEEDVKAFSDLEEAMGSEPSDEPRDVVADAFADNDNAIRIAHLAYLPEDLREVYAALLEAGHDPEVAFNWVMEECSSDSNSGVKTPFRITDDSSAAWYMRKLAEIESEVERINTLWGTEIARIAAIAEKQIQQLEDSQRDAIKRIDSNRQHFVDFFGAQFRDFVESNLTKSKRKLSFPYGKAGLAKVGSTKVEIPDTAKFIEVAERLKLSELVRVTIPEPVKSPDKKAVKELLQNENAEKPADLLEVCKLITPTEEFVVEIKLPEVQ